MMMYYKQYLASCRRAHPTKGVQSPEPGRSSQSRDARMPRVVRPHRSPLGSHRVRAGRKTSGAIEGEVLFAGQKLARGALRNLTGYVEQFDTLIGELSVKQMLMYTAELKLPPATSRADKEARVQRVITKLGLEGCADTTIGNVLQRGISGGQAKRVNIALALITQPRVLFLDEPTSGLDSHMANEVQPPVLSRVAAWRHMVAACIRWCGACTPCRP